MRTNLSSVLTFAVVSGEFRNGHGSKIGAGESENTVLSKMSRPPYRSLQPDDAWGRFLKTEREPRSKWRHVPVDYIGGHPFERKMTENLFLGERTAKSEYEGMRVQFDTHLLDALVESFPNHVSYVNNVLLPSLRKFWAETLSVIPASKIEVPLDGLCAIDIKKLSGYDLDDFLQFETSSGISVRSITNIGDNVELSSDGQNLVYNNKDLVAIVIPVEGTDLCPSYQGSDNSVDDGYSQLQTLAFATNCQNDQIDRPTVGYIGICFGPMDPTDRTSKTHERRLLTVAHEMTHIMGMNSYDFPYFFNHETGQPRTQRDWRNRPPTSSVLCVDGVRRVVEIASEDTLKATTTPNGYVAYEVVTKTVRNVARNQFDCQDLTGATLENQPTGESDCYGSHWDHRLFNNDFMASVYTGSTQYVTALTLALLEDSGWYMPNYSVAQNSPFGLGAGCDFVTEKCIQQENVPEWAYGTFCDSGDSVGCTPDKKMVAYCDISRWDGNLPSGYQYFQDPAIGGGLQQSDFCPTYTTIFRFEVDEDIKVLDCTDLSLNSAWVKLEDEVFGFSSKCIEHSSGSRPLCLNVECDTDAGKVILFPQNGEKIVCSYAGEIFRLPGGTDIICPSFVQTCPQLVCPGNCAGRGECDYSTTPPQCNCYNREDSGPFCTDSPWSFAPTVSPAPTQSRGPSASPTFTPRPTESAGLPQTSEGQFQIHCCHLPYQLFLASVLLLVACLF
mmetsp:Transcript_19140/g.37194  ORF Transcript_19140/g.37194 Transcript_19140/m.37194 type:complete len:728 (+) Transcript_19140:261-2444(+)